MVVDLEMDSTYVLVGEVIGARGWIDAHVVLIGDVATVDGWSATLDVSYVYLCLGYIAYVATCVRCGCLCWRFFYK